MIRNHSTSASCFALALFFAPGCGKKTEDTNNPDGGGADDVADGGEGEDGTTKPSSARGSTSTRGTTGGTKARAKPMKAPKPPRAKPKDGGTSLNGLLVEAWSITDATKLPDFAALAEAEQRGTIEMVNIADRELSEGFPGVTLANNFAVRLSGTINITTEAEYELCLNSDDGSQLLLENTVVVDNDGARDGATETCGLVFLAAGEYLLAIHYFQADGPRLALQFAWGQDGGDKSLVPTEVLFKPAA